MKRLVPALIFGTLLSISTQLNRCPVAAESASIGRINGELNPAISAALTARIGQLYNGDFPLDDAFSLGNSIDQDTLTPDDNAGFLLNSYLADADIRRELAPRLKRSLREKSFRKLSALAARTYAQPAARRSLEQFHAIYLNNPGPVSAASRALGSLFGENTALSAQADLNISAVSGSIRPHRNDLAPPKQTDTEQLLNGLWSRMNFVDHGKPGERAAWERIYLNILNSPTGRLYVAKLLKEYENIAPEIGFYSFEDSMIFHDNGKDIVVGRAGETEYKGWFGNVSAVRLNELFLKSKEESMMVSTLAHELLAHAVFWPIFLKAGLIHSFSHYIQDEIGARLLQSVISVEAGYKADDREMWEMVDNPASHRNGLTTTLYAEDLDLAEMRNPLDAYRKQLRNVDFAVSENSAQIRKLRLNYDIAVRLRNNRGISEETLKPADHYIQSAKDYLLMRRNTLLEAQRELRLTVARGIYPIRTHRNDHDKFEADFRHPLYRRHENEIERLKARLKKLLRGRASDLKSEKAALPIEEIRLRYDEDVQNHPDHAIPLRPGDPDALLAEIVPLFH